MKSPGRILIVDDEEGLRKLLTRIVSLEGYIVSEAGNIKSATAHLQSNQVDIILCDVKLPDGSGLDFINTAKTLAPGAEIIMLTAFGNIADGVRAIKQGAFDYLTKGDDNDRIIPLLAQTYEQVSIKRKDAIAVNQPSEGFAAITGISAIFKEALSLAKKIAPTKANVLLTGETGTGKEVFAKAIHHESGRGSKSFVAINCSAFAKDLLEAEMFGYKAGAYTGAVKDKKGLIELADQGTLFLDEIGEMNIDLQAKLLRVLESGEFMKLGDVRVTKVDVRIIAATNRDLITEVKNQSFREDLLYRLNTFTICLPALRERIEDIPALTQNFLTQFSQREGKQGLSFSKEAIEALKQHTWKGNIRELRNAVERGVILAEGEIKIQDLPLTIMHEHSPQSHSLAQVEKEHIKRMLEYTGQNKTKAAALLEIGLATLYRKMDEYDLRS